MISQDIQRTIEQLQSLPNSLHRNKAVSHAQDQLAHVLVLEMELYPTSKSEGLREPENASDAVKRDIDRILAEGRTVCSCPFPEVRSATCPLHGQAIS